MPTSTRSPSADLELDDASADFRRDANLCRFDVARRARRRRRITTAAAGAHSRRTDDGHSCGDVLKSVAHILLMISLNSCDALHAPFEKSQRDALDMCDDFVARQCSHAPGAGPIDPPSDARRGKEEEHWADDPGMDQQRVDPAGIRRPRTPSSMIEASARSDADHLTERRLVEMRAALGDLAEPDRRKMRPRLGLGAIASTKARTLSAGGRSRTRRPGRRRRPRPTCREESRDRARPCCGSGSRSSPC